MVDVVDRATRSRMMAGIPGTNTRPELRLRRALHASGFRYRLHDPSLPGKPDIVLPRWRAIIEVRGCFWHRHEGCSYATNPATRPAFWVAKFAANVERDIRNELLLQGAGWRVGIVWECALRAKDNSDLVADIAQWIRSDVARMELPPVDRRGSP